MARVVIEFKGNVVNVTKGIDKVQSKFGQLDKKITKTSNRIGKTVGRLGTQLAAVFGAGLVLRGIKNAIVEFAKFEKALTNVGTLLGDSLPLLDEYEKGLRKIAVGTSKDLVDLTEGLYDAISAGIGSTEDAAVALEFLNQAQRAAVAGLSTTKEAVKAGAIVLNVFGKEAGTVEEIYDKFFQTVRDGVTTFPELAQNLGNVATAANAAGVSFEEVQAGIVQLTKGGVATSEATTQLRQLFLALAAPTVRVKKALKEYNIELSESRLRSEGLAAVVTDLTNKTGGNLQVLRRVLGSQEALNAALIIGKQNGSLFRDELGRISGAIGTMGEAFDLQSETISEKSGRVSNKFRELATTMIETLEPAIKGFLDNVGDELDTLLKGLDELKKSLRTTLDFLAGTEAPALNIRDISEKQLAGQIEGKRLGPGGFGPLGPTSAEQDVADQADIQNKIEENEKKFRDKKGKADKDAIGERLLAEEKANDLIAAQILRDTKREFAADKQALEEKTALEEGQIEAATKLRADARERDADADHDAIQARFAAEQAADEKAAASRAETFAFIGGGFIQGGVVGAISGALDMVGNGIADAGLKAAEAGDYLSAALFAGAGRLLNVGRAVVGFLSDAFVDLVGLAGDTKPGEFKGALTEKFDAAKDFIDNLVANLPVLFDKLGPFIDSISQKIIAALPKIVDAFAKGMPKVVEALARNVGPLIDALVEQTPKIIKGIVDQLPLLIQSFLGEVVPRIPDMALAIVDGFILAFTENIDKFTEALVLGLGKAFDKLVDKLNPIGGDGGGINSKLASVSGADNIPGVGEAAEFLDKLNPLGWFHKGGVVGDMKRFQDGGIASHTNVPTLLEQGEGIIRARRTQEIGGAAAIRDLNEGRATIAPTGASQAAPVVNLHFEGGGGLGAMVADLIERGFTMRAREQGANVRSASEVVNRQFPGLPRVQPLI